MSRVAVLTGATPGIGAAVAKRLAWLVSREASYITGETLGISGGVAMGG
ncbi:MAG TPA: hypothetical protein VGX51_09825 [Solirubrobacteraceae bacterium]|jgi:NAD(P)-dependent dehydrogenase (short-subunit alcohol dehydrogenase family)|nr:hypothetical protein [Solirubrobacteraceae bacterium]